MNIHLFILISIRIETMKIVVNSNKIKRSFDMTTLNLDNYHNRLKRIIMTKILIFINLILLSSITYAQADFSGIDYSGTYSCTGEDSHEGKYTGTVIIKLIVNQSYKKYGAYSFTLIVPEYGTYLGQAAAHENTMAAHFVLEDQSTKDYGTGIITFEKNSEGKWTFEKFYYEPEYKGGNYGIENCIQR
ncbi:MAG: hypothetical protein ACI9N9_002034 [Enterobacterales bacterium]|jgi:hypothetical protein